MCQWAHGPPEGQRHYARAGANSAEVVPEHHSPLQGCSADPVPLGTVDTEVPRKYTKPPAASPLTSQHPLRFSLPPCSPPTLTTLALGCRAPPPEPRVL